MIAETYFSKSSVNWITHPDIIELVKKCYGGQIDLDPCPSTIKSNWFAKENWPLGGPVDSLRTRWSLHNKMTLEPEGCLRGRPTRIFVNPPFGTSYINRDQCIGKDEHEKLPEDQIKLWQKQTILQWAYKCIEECLKGNEIIWLSKAAVESKALQAVLSHSQAICIPEGRLAYMDPASLTIKEQPTFGSVLLYLGDNPGPFIRTFNLLGVTRKLT